MRPAAYLVAAVLLRVVNAGAVVALPIAGVERLHDIGIGGLLTASALAPSVLAAPFVGVALDRARRPGLLVAGSGAVTALAMATAADLGSAPLPLVVVALVAGGASSPFFMGGLSSFAVDSFTDERTAYAADALSYNIGSVAGPALAAALVGVDSAGTALVTLAVASAVGAAAALALRMRHRGGDPIPVGRAIREGIGWIAGHRPLAVVTVSGTVNQFSTGALPVFAVTIAIARGAQAGDSGWLVTAFAVGAIIGVGVAVLPPVRRIAPARLMGWGFGLTGALMLLLAFDLGFPATVVVLALAGIPTAPAVSAMLLLRKLESPPSVRAQVFTIGAGLRVTTAAIGAALAALLAGADIAVLAVWLAAGWLVSGAAMLAFPRVPAHESEPVRSLKRV